MERRVIDGDSKWTWREWLAVSIIPTLTAIAVIVELISKAA
jgi:hypothetical protein